MPSPVLADGLKISMPGRMVCIFRPVAAPSHSTTSARSDFVIMVASALLNMLGYFTGSPTVTESSTKRKSSPKSYDDGYTRLPTSSMSAKSRLCRSQPLSAFWTIAALVQFHLLALLRTTLSDTAKQQGGKTLSQFWGDGLRKISPLARNLFSGGWSCENLVADSIVN
jgi:hypothetical protein